MLIASVCVVSDSVPTDPEDDLPCQYYPCVLAYCLNVGLLHVIFEQQGYIRVPDTLDRYHKLYLYTWIHWIITFLEGREERVSQEVEPDINKVRRTKTRAHIDR